MICVEDYVENYENDRQIEEFLEFSMVFEEPKEFFLLGHGIMR